jgi:hypothetical protein
VVHREWPDLGATGQPSALASNDLDFLQQTLYAYHPRGTVATEFYHQAATALNDLVSARRDRLQAALPAIPTDLLLLLLLGSIVFIGTMLLFSATNERLLVVLIVGVSALTGAGLLVAVLFDYPFSGSAAISSAPYHSGALHGLVR